MTSHATKMGEFDMTVADLPAEKTKQFQHAHEDFQYWVALLKNMLPKNIARFDKSIELPNGNVVDLPMSALQTGNRSVSVPDALNQ